MKELDVAFMKIGKNPPSEEQIDKIMKKLEEHGLQDDIDKVLIILNSRKQDNFFKQIADKILNGYDVFVIKNLKEFDIENNHNDILAEKGANILDFEEKERVIN